MAKRLRGLLSSYLPQQQYNTTSIIRPLAALKNSQHAQIAYETSIIFKRSSITYGTRSLETVIGILLLSYTTHRHGKHIAAETTPQTPRPSMELHQHTPRTHDNVHTLPPTPTRRALRNQSESQMNKPVPHPAHTLPARHPASQLSSRQLASCIAIRLLLRQLPPMTRIS